MSQLPLRVISNTAVIINSPPPCFTHRRLAVMDAHSCHGLPGRKQETEEAAHEARRRDAAYRLGNEVFRAQMVCRCVFVRSLHRHIHHELVFRQFKPCKLEVSACKLRSDDCEDSSIPVSNTINTTSHANLFAPLSLWAGLIYHLLAQLFVSNVIYIRGTLEKKLSKFKKTGQVTPTTTMQSSSASSTNASEAQ